jgi:hypothetical protein
MKTKQIFWGVFLISVGILILLRNYLNFDFELGEIWKMWPLVFILIGVNLMIKNIMVKSVVSAVTAFVLALALYASVAGLLGWIRDEAEFRFDEGEYELSEYMMPYREGIKNASLNVEAGAGSFIIYDTTGMLFRANVEGRNNRYDLVSDTTDLRADLFFKMKKTRVFNKSRNRVEINLNTEPAWDLSFKIGAAAVDFDLSQYKIGKFNIDMGAASLKLRLGSINNESRVNITAGASSIDIQVPENTGCEINTDVSLSSRNFRGFTKISENLYRTDNFKDSDEKIFLDIKSGMSSISVNRYSSW